MRAVLERQDWERLERRLPAPHLLQGWDWGELKRGWGWTLTRLAWDRPGSAEPAALAQVLVRRLGRSPLRMAYLPKGPQLAEPDDVETWARVLCQLERWARGAGLTWIKIDPDLPVDAEPVAAAWRALGWRPSEEQIQFRNTMRSSLRGGESAVLAGMKAKTRYNIRLAERRGITVRRGGAEDLSTFLDLYRQTGRRAGFGLRSADYYRDLLDRYGSGDAACVILAEREGQALAGVVPLRHHRRAWYLYGASADAGREDMPAYLAQWESLRWAIEQGCEDYDWWGGPERLDASDPLWGIYRFKAGFGAELQHQLGAWDLPLAPLRFAAYRRLAAWRRARLQAR